LAEPDAAVPARSSCSIKVFWFALPGCFCLEEVLLK
jgi:hypothetical protein